MATCPITVDAAGGGDYLTIQEAVDNLPNPGPCTVIVKAGTYPESVTIQARNTLAVNESERIVIQSETPGAATVDPSTLTGTRVGVCGSGARSAHAFTICSSGGPGGGISGFLTVQGFEMTGATNDAMDILSTSGTTIAGHDLTIDGNHIHDSGGTAGKRHRDRHQQPAALDRQQPHPGQHEARHPLVFRERGRHDLHRQQHDRRERLERRNAAGQHPGGPGQ